MEWGPPSFLLWCWSFFWCCPRNDAIDFLSIQRCSCCSVTKVIWSVSELSFYKANGRTFRTKSQSRGARTQKCTVARSRPGIRENGSRLGLESTSNTHARRTSTDLPVASTDQASHDAWMIGRDVIFIAARLWVILPPFLLVRNGRRRSS